MSLSIAELSISSQISIESCVLWELAYFPSSLIRISIKGAPAQWVFPPYRIPGTGTHNACTGQGCSKDPVDIGAQLLTARIWLVNYCSTRAYPTRTPLARILTTTRTSSAHYMIRQRRCGETFCWIYKCAHACLEAPLHHLYLIITARHLTAHLQLYQL